MLYFDYTACIGMSKVRRARLPKQRDFTDKEVISMYAVIETGGKQYRVSEGDEIYVEKLDAQVEDSYTFDRVLLVGGEGEVKVGSPLVEGAQVSAKVLRQSRSKKIIVFKYKPKKNYRRKQGHRQPFTKLVIEKISV